MNARNFFAELKRRNVYKVAAPYAVVAWPLIQAASIILPTFAAPAWTMKVLISALAMHDRDRDRGRRSCRHCRFTWSPWLAVGVEC